MDARMLDFWDAQISKDRNTKVTIDFMRSNFWQSRNWQSNEKDTVMTTFLNTMI